MSRNPAAADLGDAGHGNAAHDQGPMRCDAEGTARAARAAQEDGDEVTRAREQHQEQEHGPTLLDYSYLRPGDDATQTQTQNQTQSPQGQTKSHSQVQPEAGVAASTPAPDSTPIHDTRLQSTTTTTTTTDQADLLTASTRPCPTTPIPGPSPQEQQEPEQRPEQIPGHIPSVDNAVTDSPPPSNPSANVSNPPAAKMVNSAHRRRVMANTNALTKYEAELTDQDRAKQKEAVRKYLAENVKTDWHWTWPRPDDAPLSRFASLTTDAGDTSAIAPDAAEEQWKERDEWLSNASDGEPLPGPEACARQGSPTAKDDAFCFGSPESIGHAIRKNELERRRRRKKRLAEELAYNDGLRCFNERRDEWTGARHVLPSGDAALSRTRTKRSSIYSLLPTRSASSAPEGETEADNGLARTRTKRGSIYSILQGRSPPPQDADSEREVDPELDRVTEVPVAAPILPPANAMRASITPAAYNTIYDKVVLQQLTPSCPMNLRDVTRSCVQGWKRDGEWPPRSEPPRKKGRRMSFVSLFSVDKDREEREREAREKELREKRPETPVEEKTRRPGATIGKGIRKIMFWKEKHDGHGSGSGQDANPEGRNSPTAV